MQKTIDTIDISEQIGLTPIVSQPTQGSNILDQIYVSVPCYSTVRVIKSVVKSDHQVAYNDTNICRQRLKGFCRTESGH